MDAAVSVTTVRKKHRRIGAGTVVIYLVLIFLMKVSRKFQVEKEEL